MTAPGKTTKAQVNASAFAHKVLIFKRVPTPDQDSVDDIGEAYGITYEDDEPLRTGEKLEKRDEERWELNPESVEGNE
jgi:hypothetical protein